MALLQTGKWYRVAFKHTSDPAWAALPPPRPWIPSVLIEAVINNDAAVIYVVDAVQGIFAMYGTTVYGWDDSLLLGASELKSFALPLDSGPVLQWARSEDFLYWYSEANGTLFRATNADASAFQAFLS